MYSRTLGGGYSATAPTDGYVWIAPRGGPDGTKPLVVYGHGAAGSPSQIVDAGWRGLSNIMLAVAAAGYPVIAPNAGGDTWGNDAALARWDDAVAYGQAQGAKPGKVIVMGASMGGLTAYSWLRGHMASVYCAVLFQPVSDVQDFVTNNRQGLASNVNAAYSGGYSDATYGATHNPAVFKASLAGLAAQVWYASDDTTVIPSTVTAVTTAIGGSAETHVLTGGHTDVMYQSVPTASVVAFIAAHT